MIFVLFRFVLFISIYLSIYPFIRLSVYPFIRFTNDIRKGKERKGKERKESIPWCILCYVIYV